MSTSLFSISQNSENKSPRTAGRSRPQSVYLAIDSSGSMSCPVEKAEAATLGVQEAIMEAQTLGGPGLERTYFKYTLYEFDESARLIAPYDGISVRQIDPEDYSLQPAGGMTNIGSVLQVIHDHLKSLMQELESHPERDRHPLPLVVLVSDGCHNNGLSPLPVAEKIKGMNLNGEPVVIAVAGVAVGSSDLDETLMQNIASPGCYLRIEEVDQLRQFLATVASTAAPNPEMISRVMHNGVE